MVRKREKYESFKVLASGTKDIKQDSKGYRKSRFGVQKFSFRGLSLKHPSGNVKWTAVYLKLGLKKEVWAGDINLGILA